MVLQAAAAGNSTVGRTASLKTAGATTLAASTMNASAAAGANATSKSATSGGGLGATAAAAAAAAPLDYENLLRAFVASTSPELTDKRCAAALERVARANQAGFPVRDLPFVERLLSATYERILQRGTRSLDAPLCSVLRCARRVTAAAPLGSAAGSSAFRQTCAFAFPSTGSVIPFSSTSSRNGVAGQSSGRIAYVTATGSNKVGARHSPAPVHW